MFESIYLDFTDRDALKVSHYTLLRERLVVAEAAKRTHDAMMERTGQIHANKVKKAREALEAEVERLRRTAEVAVKSP
jgi:hypothetical protein